MDLSYDGSGFHGYAKQPNVRTVQGDLEVALARHLGEVETFVAGRTDKGVHARGQVVSFTHPERIDIDRIVSSLNRQLGPKVAISHLAEAADDFHARFSATGRRYIYRVLNTAVHNPFLRTATWHVPHQLARDDMNTAAADLIGEHDFSSLCRKAEGRSLVRLVRSAVWSGPDSDGVLQYEVEASSFCHQMVRSMVALLVDVGRGRVPVADVAEILAAQDRHRGRGVAPPEGLTLEEVSY